MALQALTKTLLKNRPYVFLLIGVFIVHVATYLISPIFPVFLKKVHSLSLTEVGTVLGIGSFAFQAASLAGGVLADRYGRRAVMTTGAALQGAAMLGYSFSQPYLAFLAFSLLNGIGLGFYAPALKAMIANVVAEKYRTTAFSGRAISANLGIIIAGLVVTLFALTTNRRLFLCAAGLFWLVALLARFTLPRDRCTGDDCRPLPLSEYTRILRHRSFLLFSAVSLLIWALYAQFAFVLPLRGEHVLGTAATIGLIYTINSTVVVLFQGLVLRLVLNRINPYISLVVGTLLIGTGLFLLGFARSFPMLSASAVIFIFGEMMFLPVLDSLIGYFSETQWLSVYFAIGNFISGIGSALGTSIGGYLIQKLGGVGSSTPWIVYGIVTVCFASLVGLFALYAKPRHRQGRPEQLIFRRREKLR
ncbi:MFS transporter [Brevibacillus sp. B_LB10_24]|uniref:MFS transporter n=1 Tax=Brevibacillus sp. B_LB10_24 TaxID=3380645 RepID=UPI0038BB7865